MSRPVSPDAPEACRERHTRALAERSFVRTLAARSVPIGAGVDDIDAAFVSLVDGLWEVDEAHHARAADRLAAAERTAKGMRSLLDRRAPESAERARRDTAAACSTAPAHAPTTLDRPGPLRSTPAAAHAPPAWPGTRPVTPSMVLTGTDLGYRGVRAPMSRSSPTSRQREG